MDFLTTTEDVTWLGVRMQQCRFDFLLWEYFFYKYHARIQHVIELGSYIGGFSSFLLLQCIQYNLRFNTYDIRKELKNQTRSAKVLQLEKHFLATDVLDEKIAKEIMSKCLHPALIYCDNGNKPKEMKIYSKLARPGDLFVVHDWETEFHPRHIPATLDFIPDLKILCEQNASMTRFFYQKKDTEAAHE